MVTASIIPTTIGTYNINKSETELRVKEEMLKANLGELEVVNGKIEEANKTISEKDKGIAYLQEKNLSITNEFDAMRKDFEEVKETYTLNLQSLNSAKKELQQKKVEAVQASKKNYSKKVTSVPKDYTNWTRMVMESTGYTSYENGDELAGRKWGNLTKSGEPVRWGYVAVDTNVIPLGTEIYIPHFNMVFYAMDTGSAIKGNKIDIYFNSLNEAIKWGRKYDLEIYVNK